MLTHVSIKNYKSLADVDVELGPLTVLVGQNSSGKSNFIDALHFLSDAVIKGLDRAVIERRGPSNISCAINAASNPRLTFDLSFLFSKDSKGEYHLSLQREDEEYKPTHEKATVNEHGFEVEGEDLWLLDDTSSTSQPLFWSGHNLMLSNMGPGTSIQKIWDFLRNAGYYAIFPNSLRAPQTVLSYRRLEEGAANLNSVLQHMSETHLSTFQELSSTLSRIVPDIANIDIERVGNYLVTTLQYKHRDRIEFFDLSQESDGTLRLIAILTALYQTPIPSLITIEEPELTVHPGALKILYEAIEEASHKAQIIITTHSPDLISYCNPENIRLVEKVDGMTRISPLEQRQIDIVNDQLFSTGDLLRIEGLRPQRQG